MNIQKITVALFTLLIVALCGSWNIMADDPSDACPPLPEALDAMESDRTVTVETVEVEEWEDDSNFYYAFEPKKTDPKIGFILFPGAFVDIRAYAPPAHAIAAEGFLTVLIKMKGDLALGKNLTRADRVMSDYAGIEKWIVGGHSMGGSGACSYAKDFTENVVGVVLWASYPSENFRIDDKELKAISIYGSKNLNIENFPASAEHLPPDTPFVIIEGGNHYQFGWYDASLCPAEMNMDTTPADITREEQQEIIIQSTVDFLKQFDPSLSTVTGVDGSVWERVNQPGFGSEYNMSVAAMAEYQERLYAMTRNETLGVEVWRTSGTEWEQILFPGGEANGIYGNSWVNNLWGAMKVFKGKLYFGFSSGLQGSVLKSTGCEVWRYDGTTWEPVISDKKDSEESGTITEISGCEADDGDITAQITDDAKSWTEDEWAGGVLQITSGEGRYRRFDIITNTSDILTVQQNEVAGNVGSEYTICGSQHYANPFPTYEYDLGAIEVGDNYEIGTGNDENGFGDYWNKTITKMYTSNSKLYVSTGLNYEYGAQVWYTEDGDNWTVTEPTNSFGNFHTDSGYPNSQKPVSTSIASLSASSVSGAEVLYAGGAGSSGGAGMCSRVAKLTNTGWELIVDANVDDNDTGTNENGFGDGMECTLNTGNFVPWSLASFDNKLIAGIQSLGGARVLYSLDGSADDDSWFYSVGGDGVLPAGFDGVINGGTDGIYQNVAVNLFPFDDYLYAGLVATFAPAVGATEEYLTGSHIWKSSDGIAWEQVTGDGFGDDYVVGFEAFTTFSDTLYVSGSKGASSSTEGLGGAEIFRLVQNKCFIATASYGSYLADEVVVLRAFRDKYLLTNSVGRTLVALYCRFSPPLAEYISKHRIPRIATWIALSPIVYALKYPLVAMLVFMISGMVVAKRLRCLKRRILT